jgi:hypothetical protein
MSNCLEISWFEEFNFKENTKERKIQKIGQNPKAYCFRPLCFPNSAKRSNKKCCKRSDYVKDSEFRKLAKEAPYIYC